MNNRSFFDLYEILELSPSATFETVENMFRYHAKLYHPDNSATGSQQKFKQLLQAYNTLRDPEKRAAYDATYERNRSDQQALKAGADAAADDHAVRHRLLKLFYAQRRRNMKQPGLGITTIEEMMKIPPQLLEFHLWYFREKGWIQRELSGPLSITHAGVDEIESREAKRIQQANSRIDKAIVLPLAANQNAANSVLH